MALVLVNGANFLGRFLIRNLYKDYSKIVLADMYPFRDSVYALQEELDLSLTKHSLSYATSLKLALEDAKHVVLVTHDYFKLAHSKNFYLEKTAKLAKNLGVEKFTWVAPIELDQLNPFDGDPQVLSDQTEAIAKEAFPEMSILKTNLIFGSNCMSLILNQAIQALKQKEQVVTSANGHSQFQPVHELEVLEAFKNLKKGEKQTISGPEVLNWFDITRILAEYVGTESPNLDGFSQWLTSVVASHPYIGDIFYPSHFEQWTRLLSANRVFTPTITGKTTMKDFFKSENSVFLPELQWHRVIIDEMVDAIIGLLVTFAVNFVVFLVALLLFVGYRKCRSRSSKEEEPFLEGPPLSEREFTFFESIERLYEVSNQAVGQVCTEEAEGYLNLVRSLGVCLIWMSVASLAVLLPVYYSGEVRSNSKNLSKLSISNVSGFDEEMILPGLATLAYSSLVYFIGYSYIVEYSRKKNEDSEIKKAEKCVLGLEGLPREKSSKVIREEIYKKIEERFPGSLFDVEVIPNLTDLYRLYEEKQVLEARVDRYRDLTYEYFLFRDYRPLIRPSLCSKKEDAIVYYENKIERIEEEIYKLREEGVETNIGIGFLVCKDPKNCEMIRNYNFYTSWKITEAPHHKDIVWENQDISGLAHSIKYLTLNLFFILVFLMILTPVTLSGLLSEILQDFEIHSGVKAFISYSLPSIVLSIFQSAIIPFITSWLVVYEQHRLYSEQTVSAIKKFESYLLLNLIFFPLLGAVTLGVMVVKLYSIDILEWNIRLSENITNVGELYISFVVSMIFIGNFVDLLAVHKFIEGKFTFWRASTMQSRSKARFPVFEFSFEYCKILSMFAIVLTFSISTPLIVPLGCLYMWLKVSFIEYWVDKYNLLFVYRAEDSPSSKPRITVFKFLIAILALFELVNSGVFMVNGDEAYFILGVLLILISIATFILSFFLDRLFEIEEMMFEPSEEILELAAKIYRHPCQEVKIK